MKVAIVYDALYPEAKGGVERRVWEIACRLVSQGNSVDLLVPKVWHGPSTIERQGVRIRGVCRESQLYKRSGRRSWLSSIRHAVGVQRALRRSTYDVVDCQTPAHPAALVARMSTRRRRGVRHVITWHEAWGDHWLAEYGLLGHGGRFVERLVARMHALHISVSAATSADLESIGVVTGEVVEAAVDLAAIDAIAPRHEAEILYVGRLVPSKNVTLLLNSLAFLVGGGLSPRLVIVGDGPERNHLQRISSELGLEDLVVFKGTLDRWEDVIALMKGSKVLALPSVREGFGMVALEASACGTPIVTTDHSRNAARGLVEAGHTGFVVAPNPGDFGAALRQILEENDLRSEMGAAARASVGSGSWADVAEATLAVYRKVPA